MVIGEKLQKNNCDPSPMDYMYISPDLQHKVQMRIAFTELAQVDMNIDKCIKR